MPKSAFAKDVLKSFVNRIERLNEEREALSSDIREVFAEAKGSGFDTKILRQVIAKRKLDKADYQEQEAMFDLYWSAVGFDSTPLARSAPRGPKSAKSGDGGTVLAPHDPETGEIHDQQNAPSLSNRDVSAGGEPSSEAGPQAQASHAGTGSEMLADRDGHISEGAARPAIRVEDRRDTAAPPLMELPEFMRRTKPPPQPVA